MANLKNSFYSLLSALVFLISMWILFSSFGKISAVNQASSSTDANVYDNYSVVIDTTKELIFKVVEEMPRFPGCENIKGNEEGKGCSSKKMLEFLYANIKYPEEARRNNIQGTVLVRFIVRKDGSLDDIEAVRGIGGGCDEEAERIVNMMPKWIPGKQRGESVDVQFNLPIKYKLDNSTVKKNQIRIDAENKIKAKEEAKALKKLNKRQKNLKNG